MGTGIIIGRGTVLPTYKEKYFYNTTALIPVCKSLKLSLNLKNENEYYLAR